MRSTFSLIGLRQGFGRQVGFRQGFGRQAGRILLVFAFLLVPMPLHALTSASYILYDEAPNYGERVNAASTSYLLNEAGITWFQVPLASTSYAIVTAPPVSSSSSSSSSSSAAGEGGGRRSIPTYHRISLPKDIFRVPGRPSAPEELRFQPPAKLPLLELVVPWTAPPTIPRSPQADDQGSALGAAEGRGRRAGTLSRSGESKISPVDSAREKRKATHPSAPAVSRILPMANVAILSTALAILFSSILRLSWQILSLPMKKLKNFPKRLFLPMFFKRSEPKKKNPFRVRPV